MHRNKLAGTLAGARWPRAVATALSATFLAPIPALALTFLTPWSAVQSLSFHTAGAPAGQFVGSQDLLTPGGLGSFAQVNLGQSSAPAATTTSITIERAFRVDAANGESLAAVGALDTVFRNASFTQGVTIGHFRRGVFRVDQTATLLSGSVGSAPARVVRVGAPFVSAKLARAGGQAYFLRLTFTYTKGPDGFWHDNAPRPASPHHLHHRHHHHA